MAGPFKLRSQGSAFKQMGSSPAKKTDYAAMQAKGSDRYKNLSSEDYKTEVDRQVKSKKEGKGYNAHKYDSKGKLAKDFNPDVNKYNKPKTSSHSDRINKTKKDITAKNTPEVIAKNLKEARGKVTKKDLREQKRKEIKATRGKKVPGASVAKPASASENKAVRVAARKERRAIRQQYKDAKKAVKKT